MRYLLRRVIFYFLAFMIAMSINFFLPRMMSGDPATLMYASFQGEMAPEALEALKVAYGFDDDASLTQQYLTYLKNTFRGDLGISTLAYPSSVISIIKNSIGWTFLLVGITIFIVYTLGTTLGIMAAWKRGGFIDSYVIPFFGFFRAFPYFWIALLVLFTFSFKLGWFPLGQAYNINMTKDLSNPAFIRSIIFHGILPVTTMVLTGLGSRILSMRNNMIGIVSQDYVTLARAKGLSERKIIFGYAARNAILPSVTSFALQLGFLIGGTIVTEQVFSYPGMGYTLLLAVNARDYHLMQGVFLAITLSVLVLNFIVDLLYMFLDPRVRVS